MHPARHPEIRAKVRVLRREQQVGVHTQRAHALAVRPGPIPSLRLEPQRQLLAPPPRDATRIRVRDRAIGGRGCDPIGAGPVTVRERRRRSDSDDAVGPLGHLDLGDDVVGPVAVTDRADAVEERVIFPPRGDPPTAGCRVEGGVDDEREDANAGCAEEEERGAPADHGPRDGEE